MPPTSPRELTLTYYPWIAQNILREDLHRSVIDFATLAQEELARLGQRPYVFRVLEPIDVPLQIAMIAEAKCEIALMNPLGYVIARDRSPTVAVSLVALREVDGKIGPTYFSQLYTSKKTAIGHGADGRLRGAHGRTLGFGVPFSTSNFLVPAYVLHKMGLHPLASFSRVEFLGGHDNVAKAVYEGRIDIGAGHDGVIADLARQYGYGDAEDRLITLVRSEPIPSDPVVVNIQDTNEKSLLQRALLAAGKSERGRAALGQFWGNVKGLEPIESTAYDIIKVCLNDLNLREADVLR